MGKDHMCHDQSGYEVLFLAMFLVKTMRLSVVQIALWHEDFQMLCTFSHTGS